MFFPPYYRMTYATWKQYNLTNYEIHKAIIKYLVEKSTENKNLKIYGFEDNDFLDDIANYKDLSHYHPSINSLILNNFKNSIGLLTKDNVDSYILTAERKALNYNFNEIAYKINAYLEKK